MWWHKSVSKYGTGTCGINTIVNMKLSFTVAETSHITIFFNTFTPHLIDSKYIVNSNFHLVSTILDRLISFECITDGTESDGMLLPCSNARQQTLSFQLSRPFYMNDYTCKLFLTLKLVETINHFYNIKGTILKFDCSTRKVGQVLVNKHENQIWYLLSFTSCKYKLCICCCYGWQLHVERCVS